MLKIMLHVSQLLKVLLILLCTGTCTPEGFVIRTVAGFPFDQLENHVAKYVRAGHVQTDDSWRRTWRQAKLRHHT